MAKLKSNSRTFDLGALILGWVLGFTSLQYFNLAWAEEDSSERIQAPCGILENFAGDVQILDSTRSHLVDASVRAAIPCGSWVSVNQGWAQVRHQNGPHIHLGAQTFVQLPVFRSDSKKSPDSKPDSKEDHLLLYRGQVYVQAGDGEEEFRIISATGRARVKRGKIVLIFSPSGNETQLIALESSATLENRFEPSRLVRVQAGESTELNFKLLRVIPTLPTAISVASLKPKLAQLRVLEGDQFDAVRAAIRRQGRRFASSLVEEAQSSDSTPEKKSKDRPSMGTRKLASTNDSSDYLRHQPDPADPMLHTHWVKKMVGGEQLGERILYPDKFYGRTQRVRIDVEDPSEKLNLKQKAQDDDEKKRLIDELSRIRVE